MHALDPQPALIDRAYEQLLEAIADGTLAPGQRVRQEELGRALGVSRQPISHALQLLKQQKLVEERGRRGLIVSEIDPNRVRDLYQVRSALDALAGLEFHHVGHSGRCEQENEDERKSHGGPYFFASCSSSAMIRWFCAI